MLSRCRPNGLGLTYSSTHIHCVDVSSISNGAPAGKFKKLSDMIAL